MPFADAWRGDAGATLGAMGAARPVFVRLHSGVGNQLFQVAAGHQVAAEQNRPLALVGSAETAATLRRLVGDDLDVVAPTHVLLAPYSGASNIMGSVLRRAGALLPAPISTVIRQRPAASGLERPSLPRRRWRPVVLDGYFQHETWVPSPDALGKKIADHLSQPSLTQTAVHLRRGDFLRLGQGLPASYYEQALDLVGGADDVVVVSDDELAAEGLASRLQRLGIKAEASGGGSVVEDFATLAASRNLIMSNSTFSWWAAVAGDNQHNGTGRTVICPQPWWFARQSAPCADRWKALQW